MAIIPYTGNSDYCYANSLHMSLLAAGAVQRELPSPGFLECLTTLPFGKMYLSLEEGPLVFFSSPEINPDSGLTLALKSLGWTCQERRGDQDDEALARLREAAKNAPVLVGPVDLGYLSYNPLHADLAGGDHFLVVLAVEQDHVLLHDPWKYPYAYLPIPEFMQAWRADRVGYRSAPYTFRTHFQQVEQPTRQEMIARTLPTIKANVQAEPEGPVVYGGVQALYRLIKDLRASKKPAELLSSLIYFVFPLAARRSLDAAAFLIEGDMPEAANLVQQQALLVGKAQYLAVHKQWGKVADVMERLAEVEQELVASL